MEFINDVNVETIQNLSPYCCKTYDECKHQVACAQKAHKQQIRSSLMAEHVKSIAMEDQSFADRIQIDALNHTYQDSQG